MPGEPWRGRWKADLGRFFQVCSVGLPKGRDVGGAETEMEQGLRNDGLSRGESPALPPTGAANESVKQSAQRNPESGSGCAEAEIHVKQPRGPVQSEAGCARRQT